MLVKAPRLTLKVVRSQSEMLGEDRVMRFVVKLAGEYSSITSTFPQFPSQVSLTLNVLVYYKVERYIDKPSILAVTSLKAMSIQFGTGEVSTVLRKQGQKQRSPQLSLPSQPYKPTNSAAEGVNIRFMITALGLYASQMQGKPELNSKTAFVQQFVLVCKCNSTAFIQAPVSRKNQS